MKAQSKLFLAMFALTGAGVFALARALQPAYAAGAGVLGLLAHWKLSAGNDGDAELADSSYFLGFLLTLVLLAAGLWSLAATGSSGIAGNGRPNGVILYQFLYDLGAGLTITIAGLAIRQVRTLSAPRQAPEPLRAAPVSTSTLESLLLRELIDSVKQLPANIAARESDEPHERMRRSVDDVERGIADAAPRIVATVARLEASVATTATALTRSASALGDSFTQTSERIESQLEQVLHALAKERDGMLAQFETWRTSLANAHALLVDGHQTLDSEYRRGLLAVSAAGRSFSQLSNQVAADISRLPNPAQRLENLWAGMESLDERLRVSIGDAGTRLNELAAKAKEAGASIERLSQSLHSVATEIERGGSDATATLQRELTDLSKVLDDFVGLLNERVETVGTR